MNKSLLLHICCAPCTIVPLKFFREKQLSVRGLFYNPNIQPEGEYKIRKSVLESLACLEDLVVEYSDYDQSEHLNYVGMFEPSERCRACYRLRLEYTAKTAVKMKCKSFSTTLLISPHQHHTLLKQIGERIGNLYSIEFIYEDFRPYFSDAQKISREREYYIQNHCGCLKSKEIREKKAQQRIE
jgi:predicted adenine nucleotide alpha hydrolase (AANH) superfamily ATPase